MSRGDSPDTSVSSSKIVRRRGSGTPAASKGDNLLTGFTNSKNKSSKPKVAIKKQEWRNNAGQLHREYHPAVEYSDGRKEWWEDGCLKQEKLFEPYMWGEKLEPTKDWRNKYGRLDREDGPARIINESEVETDFDDEGHEYVTNVTGKCVQEWWRDGELYYACDFENQEESWYKDGQLHREGGPAVRCADDRESWYQDGKLHREDGPARVFADGSAEWWRDGVQYEHKGETLVDFADGRKRFYKDGNLQYTVLPDGTKEWRSKSGRLHREDGPAITRPAGTRSRGGESLAIEEWYHEGELHREDGPAVIYENGAKHWYFHGELHREDGPASIFPNGDEKWYQDGKLHREGGPAITLSDGSKMWYKNGDRHREDGPAVVRAEEGLSSSFPKEAWYRYGKLHREDGPAQIYKNGQKEWYLDGELHRKKGPAIIYPNGKEVWYKNGEEYFPSLKQRIARRFERSREKTDK